jgi:hypothetical protein
MKYNEKGNCNFEETTIYRSHRQVNYMKTMAVGEREDDKMNDRNYTKSDRDKIYGTSTRNGTTTRRSTKNGNEISAGNEHAKRRMDTTQKTRKRADHKDINQ